jgi:hypothetical protein
VIIFNDTSGGCVENTDIKCKEIMGLDQYAYVATKARGQSGDFENPTARRELAYWRKHPNLEGWMAELWRKKTQPSLDRQFNGQEVELDWDDLDELEQAILNNKLPYTQGFFFGNPSDEYYRDFDLEFVAKAKAEIFMGLRVFYLSSW